MRGTQVTQEQFDAAEYFITEFVAHHPALLFDQRVSIKWGEMVQLVAWYGALRAAGIRDGIGTVEAPALAYVKPRRPPLELVKE